jgi:hypothetical protein
MKRVEWLVHEKEVQSGKLSKSRAYAVKLEKKLVQFVQEKRPNVYKLFTKNSSCDTNTLKSAIDSSSSSSSSSSSELNAANVGPRATKRKPTVTVMENEYLAWEEKFGYGIVH